MAFTVLKISKTSPADIEVAGEFMDEDEANSFAEHSRLSANDDEYEYTVEAPPSRS